MNIAAAGLEAPVAVVVLHLRKEVPHAVIRQARTESRPRQFGNAVADVKEQAAHVGNVAWWRGNWWRRSSRREYRRQRRLLRGEMIYGFNFHVAIKRLEHPEVAVLCVIVVGNAKGSVQPVTHHGHVCQEDRTQVNQFALALRIWKALALRGSQDRIAEGMCHGARHWRILL